LNIVDELVSLLPMVLLGGKEGFLVGVHQASIALLLHHSFRHLPCRMTESQGLVETTLGVQQDALQFSPARRDASIEFRAGSRISHVIQILCSHMFND
jgi:hypothetical protein